MSRRRQQAPQSGAQDDRYGTCALTGQRGKLVRSHLLPRALMDFAPTNAPIIQIHGDASRPLKRWTSWYDRALVTRAGEDILARHDDWGVDFLRRHRLVWSSWDANGCPDLDEENDAFGFRLIDGIDPHRLRLFTLSLLWRAAATKLPEFAAVQLPEHDVERLRQTLVEGSLPRDEFYPATLMQFSTQGDSHIWAPEAMPMTTFNDLGEPTGEVPVIRFFVDGAVVLFRATTNQSFDLAGGVGMTVDGQLYVQTIPFERSRQLLGLTAGFKAAASQFAVDMERHGLLQQDKAGEQFVWRGGSERSPDN